MSFRTSPLNHNLMGNRPLFLAAAAVALFGAGMYAGCQYARPSAVVAETPGTQPQIPRDVTALGRLEPEGGLLNIGGMAGERIGEMLVEEGQRVEKGDELAYLAGRPVYLAEFQRADAALRDVQVQSIASIEHASALVNEAKLAMREVGEPLKLEIESQQAKLELLQANLGTAEKEQQRLMRLGSEIVADRQREQQRLLVKQATLELKSADLQFKQLKATAELRREQAQAKFATALAAKKQLEASTGLETARAQVASAKARLAQSAIKAPRGGQVLRIYTHAGESIGTQPILQLGDTRQLYVRAEVYEVSVARVKVGQRAIITSRALPMELTGQVEKMLWTVAANDLKSLNPMAAVDRRVVPALIRVDMQPLSKEQRELLSKLVNLQVDVRIKVEELESKQSHSGASGP